MAWTTDDLVAAIKSRARIPDANGMPDSEILAIADEELQTFILPWIVTARAHYFIKRAYVPINVGQTAYKLPSQVMAGTIFDVTLLDRNLSPLGTIPMIPLEDTLNWGSDTSGGFVRTSAFAIEGDDLTLVPRPNASGYLMLIRYTRRPNRLVPVADCAMPTGWTADTPDPGRTQFQFNSIPSTMTSGKLDFIQGIPNFDEWAVYAAPANMAATTFDVATNSIDPQFFTSAQAGFLDGNPNQPAYWCPEQTTCVVPIPDFMHPVLVSAAAAQLLRTLGDFAGAETETQGLGRKMASLKGMIEPRAEGVRARIIADSHPLRDATSRRWWNY